MPRPRQSKKAATAKTATTKTQKGSIAKQKKAMVASTDISALVQSMNTKRVTSKSGQKPKSKQAGQDRLRTDSNDIQQTPTERPKRVTRKQTRQRQRSGRGDSLDTDKYREGQISAQSVAKWQAMSKTCQDFVNQISDSTISVVLNETRSTSYEDVQDHLNNLKKRLMTNFVSLKVPNRRQPNYKDMEEHTRILEVALVETTNQVERLDNEVELQEKLLVEKEDELERLEAAQQAKDHSNQEQTKKLHSLLQGNQEDVLGLPPLRRKTQHSDTPNNFDDIRTSCQQQVVDSLHQWNKGQGEGVSQMAEYVDAVSALLGSLPTYM